MHPTQETKPSHSLCRLHGAVLLAGFLAGLFAAVLVSSIPFDYSGKLDEARRLGIVSLTILNNYPKSRDVLWYAVLILLPVAGSVGAWLVWSRGRRAALTEMFRSGPQAEAASSGRRRVTAVVLFLLLVLAAFNVNGLYAPNEGWAFLGEEGEFLAWTQILLDGGEYARDFFCLYGPLYIYPLAWFMKLFGASVVTGRLFTYGLHLLSAAILVVFLYRTIHTRCVFILSVFVTFVAFLPGIGRTGATFLRVSLGFVPLLILHRYSGSGRKVPAMAAGAALGISLLFSQEVGICTLLATGVFLFLEARAAADWRLFASQTGSVAAGCCMVLVPMLCYLYRGNALGPFFDSIIGFPRLNMLGYCSLPFPHLADFLAAPLTGGAYMPYWVIGIYLLSAISFLVLLFLGLGNRDLNFRIAVLVFGLLLFRAALGRSDESHFYFVSPPAFLLTFLLLDDAVRGLNGSPPEALQTGRRVLAALLLASLVLLLGSSLVLHRNIYSLVMELTHFGAKFTVQEEGRTLPQLRRGGTFYDPKTADDLVKIGNALDRHAKEEDEVIFFPNEAAYYFLFNRRVPTRYVHAYFAVTADQRREMTAELEKRRPEYVVYSLDTVRIDGIPEEIQVPEVVAYLKEKYALAEDLGNILLLRRKPS